MIEQLSLGSYWHLANRTAGFVNSAGAGKVVWSRFPNDEIGELLIRDIRNTTARFLACEYPTWHNEIRPETDSNFQMNTGSVQSPILSKR